MFRSHRLLQYLPRRVRMKLIRLPMHCEKP
jgi:hypothetical protein